MHYQQATRGQLLITPSLVTQSLSFKCFLVDDVRHFCRIAAVVIFEDVDESLDAATGHAFVWIDIQTRNLCAAGEMMEQAAAISDLRIEQWRIRRTRLSLQDIERC